MVPSPATGFRAGIPNTLTLNFDGGADDIPTFSLADLRACIDKGDADFFRRNFDGKVVLIGTRLDVEDRVITSKRFATGLEDIDGPRCIQPVAAPSATFRRDTIGGVYIHATAINNLINRDALREFGRFSRGLISVASAALSAIAVLTLPLSAAVLAYLALAAALDGRCNRRIRPYGVGAVDRTSCCRNSRACGNNRIPLPGRRQGQAVFAQKLRIVSRACRHR